MTQAVPLEGRVAILEDRMDDVEDLAGRTGQEVADWRATLNNHGQTLNAFGDKIDLLQERMDERFTKVDERFTKIDERFTKIETEMRDGFAKVEDKFELLRRGQKAITQLLNKHFGEPDGTNTGGAGE